MKRMLTAWTICVAVGFALSAMAHETQWPAKKLDALIPGAKFTQKAYKLTPEQVKTIEANFAKDDANGKLAKEDIAGTAYIAVGKDPKTGKSGSLGIVFFMDPKGPHGYMEAGIAVDPKGKLLAVRAFEHKEGKILDDKAFLKQFVGKTTKDMFMVGHDLKVSGSSDEPAAKALASAAKRMLYVLDAAFGTKTADGGKQKTGSGDGNTAGK